jgi:hypothetical protein
MMNKTQLKAMYQKGYRYYVTPATGVFKPLCVKSLANIAEVMRSYKNERFSVQMILPDGELKQDRAKKTLFIRPVYEVREDGTERLMSQALCTTAFDILTDEQILEHFPLDITGKEIRKEAIETFGAEDVAWGTAIQA